MTSNRLLVVAGLLVALGLGMAVSPFASSSPDGLERVAEDQGFDDAADEHDLASSPVADYRVKGIEDDRTSTAVSGLVGVLVTFGVGLGVFASLRLLRDRRTAEVADTVDVVGDETPAETAG